MKSLQLRGRRQIVKPRKYYLVRMIVFLWRVFSLFFLVSHKLGIRFNSLHNQPRKKFVAKVVAKFVVLEQLIFML